MSGCHSEAGRLFHTLKPANEKLLSPSQVNVHETVKKLRQPSEAGGIQTE